MAISIAGGVRPGKIIDIERRLYKQLIVGKQKSSAMFDELHQETEDDAQKLEIERRAIKARLAEQAKAKAIFDAISAQLTKTVNNAIEHEIASPELVLSHSNMTESQFIVLDMILDKDPNLNRLRPLIGNLSWLSRDLTAVINSPASKHRRPKSSDVRVTDLKLVINYIGVENLRTLIPYFSLRNSLPSGNANLLWTTRKLWRYSMITAIAAQALAKLHEKPVAVIYTAALMYQLGAAVILSNSIKIFDKTWGNWLREATHGRDKEVYDAVMATEFPSQSVLEHVLAHGQHLNWQIPTLLKFEDSILTKTLKELDRDYHFTELSDEASLVAKASCFAKVLLLEEQNLIEPKEKRVMYDYYEFSEQELIRLKAQSYRRVDLI